MSMLFKVQEFNTHRVYVLFYDVNCIHGGNFYSQLGNQLSQERRNIINFIIIIFVNPMYVQKTISISKIKVGMCYH